MRGEDAWRISRTSKRSSSSSIKDNARQGRQQQKQQRQHSRTQRLSHTTGAHSARMQPTKRMKRRSKRLAAAAADSLARPKPAYAAASAASGARILAKGSGGGGKRSRLAPRKSTSTITTRNDCQMLASSSSCRNEMDLIKSASSVHSWHWNEVDKSHECVVSDDKLNVCFHPECSESAAAIRGSEPLHRNGNYYYWEITVFEKTYGTSVMFGLCTKQQPLHANDYCNLVGLDRNGWSLSHKGLIWHNGQSAHYTQMFPTNQTVTIGLLFDTMRGELSYFMDGKNLGVAFRELNDVKSELYPVIGSTAKCTRMRLNGAYCRCPSLMERFVFDRSYIGTITSASKAHEKTAVSRCVSVVHSQREIDAKMADTYD